MQLNKWEKNAGRLSINMKTFFVLHKLWASQH